MGTVEIGGTTFQVYGDRAEADTYFTARIGAEIWTSSSGGIKDKGLVSATRDLDRNNWINQKTVLSQPLEFPRLNLTDKDGNDVLDNVVPLLMEEACYELALLILTDAAVQSSTGTGSNIKAVGAGSAKVEFFRPTAGTQLPSIVQELVGLWLEGINQAGVGNFASGTDGESSFCDRDRFGVIRGYP